MSKAIFGSHSVQTDVLVSQVRALRRRVAELEAALSDAEAKAADEPVIELDRAETLTA